MEFKPDKLIKITIDDKNESIYLTIPDDVTVAEVIQVQMALAEWLQKKMHLYYIEIDWRANDE